MIIPEAEALPSKAGLLWYSTEASPPKAPALGGAVPLVAGQPPTPPTLTAAPCREWLRALAGGAGRCTIRRAAPEPNTAGGVRSLPATHCHVAQGQPHPGRLQRWRDRPVYAQCVGDSVSSRLPTPFLKLFPAVARQPTAFSFLTDVGPSFMRAHYLPDSLPGAVPGPGEAAENRTRSSMPPRVSCLVGTTDTGQMITEMFSCPRDE